MPVWHDAAKTWIEQGRLTVIGITQEQHADRCMLYAQWNAFNFPILHDPINLLGPKVVPLMVAIDEKGVVRAVQPKLEEFEEFFLNQTFVEETSGIASAEKPAVPDLDFLREKANTEDSPEAWRNLGDALVLWRGPAGIDDALEAYTRSLELEPGNAETRFRLGVSHLIRYESDRVKPGDFQRAVDLWADALKDDPNQYIWRRRIQQYGPRLDKPYPFYDWMVQAVEEIEQQGGTPVTVRFPPSGSEIADPSHQFPPGSGDEVASPDPEGRIIRDTEGFIDAEVTLVPSGIRPGDSARVHVVFRPNPTLQAHWNNEAEPLRLWVDVPPDWKVDSPLLSAPQPKQAESRELRRIDFGLQAPEDAVPGPVRITAYALYYACEGKQGTCRFLRRDIQIDIRVIQ